MLRNIDTKQRIYDVVKKIPVGRVGTYGLVAAAVNSLSASTRVTPRMVGKALHQNPDPVCVPCHRVVNRKGKVAKNYAFGGAERQKEKLLKEGVAFADGWCVDLKTCLWQP